MATEEFIKAFHSKNKEKKSFIKDSDDKPKRDMKNLTCYICQAKGNIFSNCSKNKDQKSKDETFKFKKKESSYADEETCYNCDRREHRSLECFSKKKDKKHNKKPTSNLQIGMREHSSQFYYQTF